MSNLLISKSGGTLQMFGPKGKLWRTANEDYLSDAIELAKRDSSAGLRLAHELVEKAGVKGVVRFRCTFPAQIVQ